MKRTCRSLLVMMRVANLPTVWSNITAGWVLGLCLIAFDVRDQSRLLGLIFNLQLSLVLFGTSAVYAAGMILNDIFDWGWDKEHRPERPLASGQVSLATAKVIAAGLLGVGAVLIILGASPAARFTEAVLVLVLVGFVFIYNRWHKGVSWAPYVMGLCRFMLPVIGFVATGAAPAASATATLILLTHAASLWLLTVSITLLARHETRPTGLTSNKDFLLLFVPIPLLVVLPWNGLILVSAVGFWLWVLISNRRHPLPLGVGGRVEDRLAAFPFIDAMAVGLAFGIFSPLVTVVVHAFLLGCLVLILVGRRFVPVT
jgi:4-hydroxybenzoate polyprenyltransferase